MSTYYLSYRCSECNGLFYVQKFTASGHLSPHIISRIRSDGKSVSNWDSDFSSLICCPHCEAPIWIVNSQIESKTIVRNPTGKKAIFDFLESFDDPSKKVWWERLPKKLAGVPAFKPLTYAAYMKFLERLEVNDIRIPGLQYLAWQLLNDLRETSGRTELTTDERNLLENLVELGNRRGKIYSNPDEVFSRELIIFTHESKTLNSLQRAELLRELSRFDEARKMLNCDFDFEIWALAEQMMQAIERKDHRLFDFVQEKKYSFSYAWQTRRLKPEEPTVPAKEIYPPVFKIGNRDWWVKILGVLKLNYNWALIEENPDGSATVYLFDDQGKTMNRLAHRIGDVQFRSAVVDSLDFETKASALVALKLNGFERLKESPGPWMDEYPRGHFYDARETEAGIYSIRNFWTV